MKDRGEILNDYLFGDLPEAERSELERQIAADPQLAAEVAELAPVVSQLEALPDEAWEAPAPPPLRLDREPARQQSPVAGASGSRESVFGRFYRGSDARSSAKPGIGLGLYLSRRFVEAHGGQIRLDDRPGGTRVSLTLLLAIEGHARHLGEQVTAGEAEPAGVAPARSIEPGAGQGDAS